MGQTQENYRHLITPQVRSDKLPPPQHLRDYVVAGKLRLTLRDAILLTLENNSSIRVQEAQVEGGKFDLLRAHQLFDPQLKSAFSANRFSFPVNDPFQAAGVSTNAPFNSLTQTAQINYSQLFQTGTSIIVDLSGFRNSTGPGQFFFNPSYNTILNLQFTQPLLRNAGLFVNRAPLIIARRVLQQSRASFEVQVSETILQAVKQYWEVVQARGNIEVRRRSLEAANATYQHDKRALELGALPPLDIYRSESDVATRRVQMIQSEYLLKQAEDELRLTIGANQDPLFHALDLDLVEKPEPEGELQHSNAADALNHALAYRPELVASQYALANDDTNIRLAHNHLKPDLALSGFYQSSGLGGNQYDLVVDQTTGQVISSALVSRGGLGSSFNQLFGFSFPGYGASLTLNLPIRNRGAQADMGSALVFRHRDQYVAQQLREQVMRDVSNAVHQLEQTELTLSAGKIAVDLAKKEVAAEQRKYDLGEKTISFLLDSQTRLAQIELDLLQAQIQYQNARATLNYATGGLLEPYGVQIAELVH
jgi:HAE1 family hydrophobic/amphiphilic exporter-1